MYILNFFIHDAIQIAIKLGIEGGFYIQLYQYLY